MTTSAGLLVYRMMEDGPEILLAHPGGPLWRRKDLGAWMIPKGEIEDGEEPLAAALREFHEETGLAPAGPYHPLTPIRQKGGKQVICWMTEIDLDLARFIPGEFEMEWPPRSGRMQRFPEIDQLRYFGSQEARVRILSSQSPLLEEALGLLD